MIRKEIKDMRKGKQMKYMQGFKFNFQSIEKPKLKDLDIFVSQNNSFPDEINYEEHYLNKHKFMYHTDIRRRDNANKRPEQVQPHEVSKF
jgi:hypothetical protein